MRLTLSAVLLGLLLAGVPIGCGDSSKPPAGADVTNPPTQPPASAPAVAPKLPPPPKDNAK